MSKIVQFGENVEGYSIPVLNEREVRAAAGLLFVLMFVSIMLAAVKSDFTLLKYAISIFLADMLVRVFINPKYAPSLIVGRWFVRNQVPEYVGAMQKKFAWYIGVGLALIMVWFQIIANTYGPITGMICMICLVFLFFESAFGICLGCWLYKIIKKEKAQYCPGEVCELHERQDVQKISWVQWLIVAASVAYIVLIVLAFQDNFSQQPTGLFIGSN